MRNLIAELSNAVRVFNDNLQRVVNDAVEDISTGLVNRARAEGECRVDYPVGQLSSAAIKEISHQFKEAGFQVSTKRSHHQLIGEPRPGVVTLIIKGDIRDIAHQNDIDL